MNSSLHSYIRLCWSDSDSTSQLNTDQTSKVFKKISNILLTENIQNPVIFFDVVDSMKFVVDSSTSDHLHVVAWIGGEPGNKIWSDMNRKTCRTYFIQLSVTLESLECEPAPVSCLTIGIIPDYKGGRGYGEYSKISQRKCCKNFLHIGFILHIASLTWELSILLYQEISAGGNDPQDTHLIMYSLKLSWRKIMKRKKLCIPSGHQRLIFGDYLGSKRRN